MPDFGQESGQKESGEVGKCVMEDEEKGSEKSKGNFQLLSC